MLEIRGLSAGYGGVDVLDGIDVTVPSGAIVALVGANGAGKTTLAKVISGLVPVRAGEILFAAQSIVRLSPLERVRLGIAHVPEGRQIIAGLTVAENLRLGAFVLRRELGANGMARRIEEVCRPFPTLIERMDMAAGNLSGGQQQMLAIARGLMMRPKLLVLDEPSLGLSPTLVTQIFALIDGLRGEGLAILLSEQNARRSLAIADHGYIIEMGRVVLEGHGRDLRHDDAVAERYLGIGKAAATATSDARHAALVDGLRRILRD